MQHSCTPFLPFMHTQRGFGSEVSHTKPCKLGLGICPIPMLCVFPTTWLPSRYSLPHYTKPTKKNTRPFLQLRQKFCQFWKSCYVRQGDLLKEMTYLYILTANGAHRTLWLEVTAESVTRVNTGSTMILAIQIWHTLTMDVPKL